tara:strand:+ start:72 stop:470 length:399 start_codon:yes stop_codon:yes gene_type:complete
MENNKPMSKFNIQITTGQSFGIAISIVFLIVALYPLSNSETLHIWAFIVSSGLLILSFIAPQAMQLWLKFAILLGSIITPIGISVIYFIVLVPMGIIMRLLGKDLLKQKLDKNAKSYWIERSDPIGSMKNQF